MAKSHQSHKCCCGTLQMLSAKIMVYIDEGEVVIKYDQKSGDIDN